MNTTLQKRVPCINIICVCWFCFPGLFHAFDENRDNHIDFKEISCGLSACCRGPIAERQKCKPCCGFKSSQKNKSQRLRTLTPSLFIIRNAVYFFFVFVAVVWSLNVSWKAKMFLESVDWSCRSLVHHHCCHQDFIGAWNYICTVRNGSILDFLHGVGFLGRGNQWCAP